MPLTQTLTCTMFRSHITDSLRFRFSMRVRQTGLALGRICAGLLLLATASVAQTGFAPPLAVRWSELPPLLKGRQISVHLTDGTIVEGKYSSLQADALSIEIKKSSDPVKHPKGALSVARSGLTEFTILRHRGNGRKIGMVVGGAIAAMVACVVIGAGRNEGTWNGGPADIALVGGLGAGVIRIGYLIGLPFDHRSARPAQVVRILSEVSR